MVNRFDNTTSIKMTTVQVFILLVALCGLAHGRLLIFENRLNYTIWVGSQGNSGKEPVKNGGWEMIPGSQMPVDIPDDWAGRFWGRTGCNFDKSGNGHCETGDCGNRLECGGNGGAPPVTLAQLILKGWGGKDFYDITLAEGFNIPAIIFTFIKASGRHHICTPASCRTDINLSCPSELRYVLKGRTVGCMSPCRTFNTDQYCCRGDYARPQTCQSKDWPTDYPALFKSRCPDARSFAYDNKGIFVCKSPAYRIQFG